MRRTRASASWTADIASAAQRSGTVCGFPAISSTVAAIDVFNPAVEKRLILATVQHTKTREAAAAVLGISVKTLYNRLRAYESAPIAIRSRRSYVSERSASSATTSGHEPSGSLTMDMYLSDLSHIA